jgi:hypothetical protein
VARGNPICHRCSVEGLRPMPRAGPAYLVSFAFLSVFLLLSFFFQFFFSVFLIKKGSAFYNLIMISIKCSCFPKKNVHVFRKMSTPFKFVNGFDFWFMISKKWFMIFFKKNSRFSRIG